MKRTLGHGEWTRRDVSPAHFALQVSFLLRPDQVQLKLCKYNSIDLYQFSVTTFKLSLCMFLFYDLAFSNLL